MSVLEGHEFEGPVCAAQPTFRDISELAGGTTTG